jgi:hypothetical protein
MSWSTTARPTPANAKRRLFAAIDALSAADSLILRMPGRPGLAETRNARAWAESAVKKLGNNHKNGRPH